MTEEYLKRNLALCASYGVEAGMIEMRSRLLQTKRPPKWLLAMLSREIVKMPKIKLELYHHRNEKKTNRRNEMKTVVSLSGGKDSTAMLHMMIARGEKIDTIVFMDTGWEFPEMIRHIDMVEKNTERKINRVFPKLDFDYVMTKKPIIAKSGLSKGKIHRYGNGWPSPMRRWCTREKVNSIRRFYKTLGPITECIGFAADEEKRTRSRNILDCKNKVRFPLIEYGVTELQAEAYCRHLGYTWDGLYDDFRRVSCFCCPLQRIGELRKLRKLKPDLWERMLKMDKASPTHNKGFMMYATVHDMEKRFADEDRQGNLFTMEGFEKKEEDWAEKCGKFCERI